MKRALLLTGKPGTGKTALIKEALAGTKVRAGGFYTEEMRAGGAREGFRLVTLDGQSTVLAHVGISGPLQVSASTRWTQVLWIGSASRLSGAPWAKATS